MPHAPAPSRVIPSKVKHRLRRGQTLVVFGLSLLLLVMLEAGVRIRAWMRHGVAGTEASIFRTDDAGDRRLAPHAIIAGDKRQLTINRWGLRGPDISLAKPANTLRVVALGESTTFGLEASNDSTIWTAKLEQFLNDGAPSTQWQVINAGIPGNTIDGCRRFLRDELLRFSPDVLIVLCGSTDLSAHARLQHAYLHKPQEIVEGARPLSILEQIQKHSLLYHLLRLNTAALRSALSPATTLARLDDRGVTRFRSALAGLVSDGEDAGMTVVLCTYPRAFGDKKAPTPQWVLARSALAANPQLGIDALNDAFDRYNGAIAEVADAARVALVDLATLVPRRTDYFYDSVHFNDDGHTFVAQQLAATLAEVMRDSRLARLPE